MRKDVAEGAAIDYEKLTNSTDTFTVKKAGKGVQLTDESVLSGYGDPVGEATRQITMAIAAKLDNDTVATAAKSRLKLVSADFTKLDLLMILKLHSSMIHLATTLKVMTAVHKALST
ncbi:MAG: hypothetical protein ACFWTU_09105 [Leuconostoc mesenteroides]|jgi:N4-gp56 family major capsid protein